MGHHDPRSEYYRNSEQEASPQGPASKVNQTPPLARRSTGRSHSRLGVAPVWMPNCSIQPPCSLPYQMIPGRDSALSLRHRGRRLSGAKWVQVSKVRLEVQLGDGSGGGGTYRSRLQ